MSYDVLIPPTDKQTSSVIDFSVQSYLHNYRSHAPHNTSLRYYQKNLDWEEALQIGIGCLYLFLAVPKDVMCPVSSSMYASFPFIFSRYSFKEFQAALSPTGEWNAALSAMKRNGAKQGSTGRKPSSYTLHRTTPPSRAFDRYLDAGWRNTTFSMIVWVGGAPASWAMKALRLQC